MELRDYQNEFVAAVEKEWQAIPSTLGVLPTGTGKTVCFVALMERHRQQVGGRCLVIAPMIELIDQAAEKIRQVTGVEPGIEQSFRKSNEGSCRSPFVVASKQTLAGKSNRKDRIKDISMVVYDEAHTAATARGRDLLRHYMDQGAVLLGVTATPKRHDKRAMGDLFDSVAYHMDIPTAVDLGWLCRPRAKTVVIESLDLSAVTTRGARGDFKEGELAEVMNQDTVVREIAAVTENEIGGDKTIVFCASVKEAIGVAQILQASGVDADFVCSDESLCPLTDRNDKLQRFKRGSLQVLTNVGILTTGIDIPDIAHIVMARPTKSEALYTQMIGRATRPLPGLVDFQGSDPDARKNRIAGSAKPHFRITDMVDVSRTHKLVRAHDILAGEPIPELTAILDATADKGQEQDVIEQVRSARQEAARIKAQQELRRMEAMRRMVRTNAHYTTEEIDLFADEIIRNGGVRRIASMRMPFGKHKGLEISNVPSGYLRWMLENVKLYGKLRAAITREMAHRECAAHR